MQSTTQFPLQSDVDISLLGTALVVDDDEARTPGLVLLGILLLSSPWGDGFFHQEGVGVQEVRTRVSRHRKRRRCVIGLSDPLSSYAIIPRTRTGNPMFYMVHGKCAT